MKYFIVITVIIYIIQNYIRIYIKKYTLDNTIHVSCCAS